MKTAQRKMIDSIVESLRSPIPEWEIRKDPMLPWDHLILYRNMMKPMELMCSTDDWIIVNHLCWERVYIPLGLFDKLRIGRAVKHFLATSVMRAVETSHDTK